MRILKSLCISFSLYSKIPVPQFAWEEDDMKYVLCFFPWIGVVTGALLLLWSYICKRLSIGNLAFTCIGTALPLLVTGGFHADGFMDTMDAFHSYKEREEKLEILKDSHIGAFSVLMLALYYLIYLAAFSEIKDGRALLALGFGYVISRCLSGIGVVTFRSAKNNGLLYTFADSAAKRAVRVSLYLQLILCAALLIILCEKTGVFVLIAAAGSFLYYRYRSYHELGGITGDTAGYFVMICEAAVAVAATVGGRC